MNFLCYLVFPFVFILSVVAIPTPGEIRSGDLLLGRTDPFFPDQPPSCPLCAKDYPSISSCAQAAPVLQNFTSIIFNPGAFIDVIKCACVDTFQSAFPQCVDCFIQTGQENVLNSPNLPAVVDGMRRVCMVESTLLGNASFSNGEATPVITTPAPVPTSSGALGRGGPEEMVRIKMSLLVTFVSVVFASLVQ